MTVTTAMLKKFHKRQVESGAFSGSFREFLRAEAVRADRFDFIERNGRAEPTTYAAAALALLERKAEASR